MNLFLEGCLEACRRRGQAKTKLSAIISSNVSSFCEHNVRSPLLWSPLSCKCVSRFFEHNINVRHCKFSGACIQNLLRLNLPTTHSYTPTEVHSLFEFAKNDFELLLDVFCRNMSCIMLVCMCMCPCHCLS